MNKTALLLFICAQTCFASMSVSDNIEKMMDTGRFKEAGEALLSLPEDGEKRLLKAKMHFYQGEYGKAERALRLSAPSMSWDRQSGALADHFAALERNISGHESFESAHFTFKAKGRDRVLASYALEALEKIYAVIGKELGCLPESKVLVEIYETKNEFSLASTIELDVLEKSGTVGICKFNRLMLLSPESLPLGYSWADTLCHEYTHFIVNRISRGECPLWLHEGIAKYYDTAWRLDQPEYLTPYARNSLLKARKNNSFISFERMHPSLIYLKDQEEILLAFAQVSSAVAYMRDKYGRQAVPLLAARMAEKGEKPAFKNALGVSEERFERDLIKNLKQKELTESPGAVPEKINFVKPDEEEFIGAGLRGQVRLGDKMRQIGKPEAAAIQYEKAIQAEPANPVLLLKAAKAYMEAGESGLAVEKLKTAVEKNPNYVTVFEMLGELYLKTGQYGLCVENLLRATMINPYNPDTHFAMANAYAGMDERKKAVSELKALLLLRPEDAVTRLLLDKLKREDSEKQAEQPEKK